MVIMPDSAQQAMTCPRHDRIDIVSQAQHRRLEDLSSSVRTSSDQEREREKERERKREREGYRRGEIEREIYCSAVGEKGHS